MVNVSKGNRRLQERQKAQCPHALCPRWRASLQVALQHASQRAHGQIRVRFSGWSGQRNPGFLPSFTGLGRFRFTPSRRIQTGIGG